MDIGEQQRVIVVEPEPLAVPDDAPPREDDPTPEPRPDQEPASPA